MPFFEMTPPPDVNPIDLANAEALASAIRARALFQRPYRMTTWAEAFRKLRVVDQVDEARLSNVLKWYCAHIGGEFIPQAYSADGFRKKFLPIEQAYKRSAPPSARCV